MEKININRINELNVNTFGTKMKIVNYRKWNDIDLYVVCATINVNFDARVGKHIWMSMLSKVV